MIPENNGLRINLNNFNPSGITLPLVFPTPPVIANPFGEDGYRPTSPPVLTENPPIQTVEPEPVVPRAATFTPTVTIPSAPVSFLDTSMFNLADQIKTGIDQAVASQVADASQAAEAARSAISNYSTDARDIQDKRYKLLDLEKNFDQYLWDVQRAKDDAISDLERKKQEAEYEAWRTEDPEEKRRKEEEARELDLKIQQLRREKDELERKLRDAKTQARYYADEIDGEQSLEGIRTLDVDWKIRDLEYVESDMRFASYR
ncbi:MAG: hypothetical protein HYU64_08875 [Armatimonadetes bacterium]|nr:hypothetical protein [Armatimonadota bacterium]